jgi:hypothetical protein
MKRNHLNFFEPFERLEPNHENQLTRALLVVLWLSPMAHECWLSLVGVGSKLHDLPVAEFATQRRAIRQPQDVGERVRLVSVFLAPTAPLGEDTVVRESQRQGSPSPQPVLPPVTTTAT